MAKPTQPDRATSLLRVALVIGSLVASVIGGRLVAARDVAQASPKVIIRRASTSYSLPPVPTAIAIGPGGYQPPVVNTGGGTAPRPAPVARTSSSR